MSASTVERVAGPRIVSVCMYPYTGRATAGRPSGLILVFQVCSVPYQVRLAQLAPPFAVSAEPEVEMDAKGTLGREGHAVETGILS